MGAIRYATDAARAALAARFGLRLDELMQDWEWEVADPLRLAEFLSTYSSGQLTDEERFSLMEIIVQSVEELPTDYEFERAWILLEPLLLANATLHQGTVEYWACLNAHAEDEMFRVSPRMRLLYERIRT